MANAIIEIIAQNIETSINAITQSNGFHEDLTAIRPKIIDFDKVTPIDRIVLIVQETQDKAEAQPIGSIEWLEPFAIVAFVINSETSEEAIDIRRNRIRADIQKKLAEDIQRGGYAINTIFGGSNFFDDGEGFSGVMLEVIVHYRVKEDDPYTIG